MDAVNANTPGRMLGTKEAAILLGISPATLETWRSRKTVSLPYVKYSKRCVRYNLADLNAFKQARVVNPQSQAAA